MSIHRPILGLVLAVGVPLAAAQEITLEVEPGDTGILPGESADFRFQASNSGDPVEAALVLSATGPDGTAFLLEADESCLPTNPQALPLPSGASVQGSCFVSLGVGRAVGLYTIAVRVGTADGGVLAEERFAVDRLSDECETTELRLDFEDAPPLVRGELTDLDGDGVGDLLWDSLHDAGPDPDSNQPPEPGQQWEYCSGDPGFCTDARVRPPRPTEWHVTEDRAFSGRHSLAMNHANGGRLTYSLDQLSFVRTRDVRVDPSGDAELEFWHMVSLVDDRSTNTPPGETSDRAVLTASIVRSDGTVLPARRLEPTVNGYVSLATEGFLNAAFDTTDDARLPEQVPTVCAGLPVWSEQGSTVGEGVLECGQALSADPADCARGDVPIGTWVRTVVSLAPFAGETVRLRWLVSSISACGGDDEDYESLFGAAFSEGPSDDGWFIDDLHVDGICAD